MSDYFSIKTRLALKSSCYVGHEYTPENTFLDIHGYRCCKACAKVNNLNRVRKFRQRQAIASAAET